MAVWGGLISSWEKKRSKSKGERERYTHLNAEFQSIARRDKKAFLRDQCKEIEENNRMGNTRDLFKKIRDTKGTFHAKMGSIKDRNGMDLTEAEIFRKGRRTRDQIANICRIIEKAREFQKISASASLTKLKPLTVWITADRGKFKKQEYQTTYLPPEKPICKSRTRGRTGHGTTDWFKTEYIKAVMLSPCFFNFHEEYIIWNALVNQDCWEKYKQPKIYWWYHSNGRKRRGTKEPLDEGKRGEWENWLKTQCSKNKDHGIQSHHFIPNRRGKQWKQRQILFSWAPKSLQMLTTAMKLKDACSLEERLWQA